ncbi:MAG: carbon storage regulator [Planctomycetaceae bacterium]|nr:carbon storage regulator [Planctomycetaceae bacterium]
MLVLSRKRNESIVLPDLNLTIRVAEISGGRVRLAVEAPREVTILRKEVADRLEAELAEDAEDQRRLQSLSGEHLAIA